MTDGCAVVTFDHEHVPTDHLRALVAAGVPCRPGPDALVHAQDKARDAGAADRPRRALPAPRRVADAADVAAFGFPCVLKTTRGGYDGKGVWFVSGPDEAATALAAAAEAGAALLAEELVEFRRELSALVVRTPERPGGGVRGRRVGAA